MKKKYQIIEAVCLVFLVSMLYITFISFRGCEMLVHDVVTKVNCLEIEKAKNEK